MINYSDIKKGLLREKNIEFIDGNFRYIDREGHLATVGFRTKEALLYDDNIEHISTDSIESMNRRYHKIFNNTEGTVKPMEQMDMYKPKITLEEYQEFTPTTFIVPEYQVDAVFAYLFSGLVAEAGEVAGNYAKYVRGDFELDELRKRTFKELGDVMYFVTQLANELDYQLDDILMENKFKLHSRMKANKIKGDGESLDGR